MLALFGESHYEALPAFRLPARAHPATAFFICAEPPSARNGRGFEALLSRLEIALLVSRGWGYLQADARPAGQSAGSPRGDMHAFASLSFPAVRVTSR